MKILWVKGGGLVPPDSGGKIRSFHILRELAREHSVTFFSFYGEHANDLHFQLNEIFERVVCVPLRLPKPKGLGESLNYVGSAFSREPYNLSKYCRPEVRRNLRSLMTDADYDVIVCDFLVAAGVVPWELSVPKVLFTHNVEAIIWRRHFEFARNPFWKALSWVEWRKMYAAEQHYLQLADHVLAVSENDRNSFMEFLDGSRLSVIATGVDTEFFQPCSGQELPETLVFTGSMDWLPNEDGIIYFVEQILPLIRAKAPDTSLCIVGRKPSRRLQEVAKDNNIQLTGWVADIRPYLARSAVCVVPLRIGGGTRLKIFEAMAMGKAVVSTSVGAEGLPVSDGENIIIADDPAAFANSVVALSNNLSERKRLGNAARKLVEENYSWRKVARGFAEMLVEVLERRHGPVSSAVLQAGVL